MANTIFAREVLEDRYESVLTTSLNMNTYVTIDNTLAEAAGMRKRVVTQTVVGGVQDLAEGEGNTTSIEVKTSDEEYTVTTTQGRFVYTDEAAMSDPAVVDSGLKGTSETMVNDFVSKAVAEWEKATLKQTYNPAIGINFETIVDAIAQMNVEDEGGLFLLINPAQQAMLRKNLKTDLSYVEAFTRTGYIGTVCGVPVYVSKAVTDGKAILAGKGAVTVYIKKGSEVESERDINKRTNTVIVRKVALVALTDANKVVLIEAE